MIRLYVQGDCWMGDHSKSIHADTIYDLFGTYQIPTAFTAQASAERVQHAIQILNDEIVVAEVDGKLYGECQDVQSVINDVKRVQYH